jgi:hypothetical protein
VAHQRGLSAAAVARWRSAPVLGRRSGGWHRGIVEELEDRAVALERTARLGSGWRLQAALLTLQLPTTADKRERGGGGWRLRLLRRWRTTTCTEGRRREVSGELGPVTARGRAAAGVESSATRRRTVQCGVGSASTVDGEARRSRGGRAHAVARAAALPSDSGRGSFGQRPLGPGYNRVCGNRERRPRQPVRARHAAA